MSKAELPATSDFYALESTLPDRDRALLAEVRGFMREEVAPIINDYWSKEEFPHQVFPRMAEIGMGGMALEGYGCANRGGAHRRIRRDGDGGGGLLGRDRAGCAQPPGDGLDLSLRI